jgi:hypothetical protein
MKKLLFIALLLVACSEEESIMLYDGVINNTEVKSDYKPYDFLRDYSIDLKQDGYLILDEQGEVYYVPFDQLEEWFLEMNL